MTQQPAELHLVGIEMLAVHACARNRRSVEGGPVKREGSSLVPVSRSSGVVGVTDLSRLSALQASFRFPETSCALRPTSKAMPDPGVAAILAVICRYRTTWAGLSTRSLSVDYRDSPEHATRIIAFVVLATAETPDDGNRDEPRSTFDQRCRNPGCAAHVQERRRLSRPNAAE